MAIGVEQPELRTAADKLRFPEGPVALPAGSIALVGIKTSRSVRTSRTTTTT